MIAYDGCGRSRRLVACEVSSRLALCGWCRCVAVSALATVGRHLPGVVPGRTWLQRICLAATLPEHEADAAVESLFAELQAARP